MQQIERLLRDGKSSRQVIDTGYKPSSVYKAQRRLRAGVGGARSGAIAQRGNRADETVASDNDPVGPMAGRVAEHRDAEVESHPDIIELKRELRKAQLQSQIAAVRVKHLDPAVSPIAHVEITIGVHGDYHGRQKLSIARLL